MAKVYCFIDGFNLYHALDRHEFKKYKWLNVRSLAEKFIQNGDTLERVIYFTARCPWSKEKRLRHTIYTDALSKHGVITKLGNFKTVTRTFRKNRNKITMPKGLYRKLLEKILPKIFRYEAYEEKQTDVNIGVDLIYYGQLNSYDSAILISADTDLKDAVKLVVNQLGKPVRILFPPRDRHSKINIGNKQMKEACHGNYSHILEDHFKNSQLPDTVEINPSKNVSRPESWN